MRSAVCQFYAYMQWGLAHFFVPQLNLCALFLWDKCSLVLLRPPCPLLAAQCDDKISQFPFCCRYPWELWWTHLYKDTQVQAECSMPPVFSCLFPYSCVIPTTNIFRHLHLVTISSTSLSHLLPTFHQFLLAFFASLPTNFCPFMTFVITCNNTIDMLIHKGKTQTRYNLI